MKILKKPIIFLLIFLSNAVTFQNKFDYLMKDFKNSAVSEEAAINRHIDLISSYADVISIFENSYYLGDGISNSIYYNYLKYDSEMDYYHMDSIGKTELIKTEGNLTGKGSIPKGGSKQDELNLALHYNKIFYKLYEKLPDVLCLNYISVNEFVNRYPFISSKEFRYTDDLKKALFYTEALPVNNPVRQAVWTPVYLNQAGTDLILTYSIPVYNKNEFMGVVSIDFTNMRFCEMVDSKYESFLVDKNNSLVASDQSKVRNSQIITLDKLLDSSIDIVHTLNHMEEGKVKRIGSYFVCAIHFTNAPWTLFIRVSVWSIIAQSLFTTLPIILICSFLVLVMNEVDKRIKTERLLKDTIVELKSYQKLLESAAKMDFLTTTYNRRGFKEKLNENMKKGKANQTPISLLIGDIDYFKQYNDTYGHAAGDKVLVKAADIMKKNVNKNDIVCRWGGEEFLIMLHNKTYQEALIIAENIRKEIETTVIKLEDPTELSITITLGVAEYDENESFDDCVSKADRALYIGKELGRNRVIGSRDSLQS